MRKMVITLLALGVFAASAAFAGNLVNDNFDRPNGNLAEVVNATPSVANSTPPTMPLYTWGNYSGVGMDVLLRSNEAYFGLTDVGQGVQDDHVCFATQATSVPTYACFNLKIPCFAATAPKAIYFAGFLGSTSITNMLARTFMLPFPGGPAGAWTLGISFSSVSTTVGVAAWPAALVCDTWYTVVIKYDPSSLTATLWVNPVSEASPSVSIVGTAAAEAINQFFIRQSASASALPPSPNYTGTLDVSYKMDNLGVGTSFALACYTIGDVPVPTKGSTWGHLKSLYR